MMASKRTRPTETDLKKLKALSHSLLELDIQTTKMSPLVVKHLFTNSGIVGLRKEDGNIAVTDLTSDPAALRVWREQCRRLIDGAEKPFELFLMITKPYKLGFLKYAAPFLSEHDTALFLPQAWTTTESPNSDPNLSKRELLSLFRSADPQKLMDEEEYELFRSLEDVVTVYRGVTPYNAKNVKALSWTLNRDTAEWFAYRYGEQGTVYEAQIPKEHMQEQAEALQMKGDAKMQVNAMTEEFEHIEIFGKPVLFTNARVDKATIPKNWYRYDIRGSDSNPGSFGTLEHEVAVNHAGTILSPEDIPFSKGKDYNYGYTVETDRYRYLLRCNPIEGDYQAYLSCFDKQAQKQIIGRVSFASGEQIEYTDPEKYLKTIREELPFHATSGFHFETLTSDPEIRKAADDALYDLYGEENPRKLEEYQEQPDMGMTMGGM